MTTAQKDPDQIEREANEARSQLKQTVDALSARLSPGQLLDQVMGMTKEHGGAFAKNLGGQVKQNPLALLLTGIGAIWLMIGSGRQESESEGVAAGHIAGNDVSSTSNNSSSARDSLKDKLDSNMHSVKASAHDTKSAAAASATEQRDKLRVQASATKSQIGSAIDSAQDGMASAKSSAQDGMASARSSAQNFSSSAQEAVADSTDQLMNQAAQAKTQFDTVLREQPLIAGALGVALGAAIGALVPPSEKEDQLMGRHADDMKAKTLAAADEQYDTARDTALRKAEEVSQSVDRKMSSQTSQQRV